MEDQLDLVAVHYNLARRLKDCLPTYANAMSPDEQSSILTNALCLQLGPAFRKLWSGLAAKMMQGCSLSGQNLIDLLTLKDNNDNGQEDNSLADGQLDYATALEVHTRTYGPDEGRERLKAIWRRSILRDE